MVEVDPLGVPVELRLCALGVVITKAAIEWHVWVSWRR